MAVTHALDRVFAELKQQGWEWRRGKKHIVLYPADKRYRPFTVSGSPGDVNARRQMLREIKRAGGIIETNI